MAHKTQTELAELLADAIRKVEVGGRYSHYKNPDQTYRVLHLGFLEASDAPCVMYQAEYGAEVIFVRPVAEWVETVSHQGRQVPRYAQVD